MKRLQVLGIIIGILGLIACGGTKSEYQQLADKELASGARYDSLFLGLHFGMSSEAFYKHCWELNKKGYIMEGPQNATARQKIEVFENEAFMDFYPSFHEDKIWSMPVTFQYAAWSPWNKHLWSDKLIEEVKDLMDQWYGPGYIEVKNPGSQGSNAYIKVNGNRRISIYYAEEAKVHVDFVDLPTESAIKAAERK